MQCLRSPLFILIGEQLVARLMAWAHYRWCLASGVVISVLSIATLAVAAEESPADALADVSRFDEPAADFTLERGKERGQRLAVASAAPDGEKALKVEFVDSKEWAVVNFGKSVPIPDALTGRRMVLRAHLADAPSVIGAAIRLRDRSGEIHQWRTRFEERDGWQQVTFDLEPQSKQHGAWGGDGNGKPDAPLVVAAVALECREDRVGSGTAFIQSLQISLRPDELLDRVSARIIPSRSVSYVQPVDLPNAGIELTNPLNVKQVLDLSIRTRAHGKDWKTLLSARVEIPARGRHVVPLADAVDRFGVWSYDVSIARPGAQAPETPVHRSGTFAFVDLPEGLPPPVGIELATTEVGLGSDAELARRLGFNAVRVGYNWHQLQQQPGQWRWEPLDKEVATAERAGLRVQMLLGYGALWAATNIKKEDESWRTRMTRTPEMEAWRTYVREVARRYRDRVAMYEIWNEPDLMAFYRGTTDEYLALLRAASEEIRAADPRAKVMTGGFATVLEHGGHSLNPDLHRRTIAEAQDAFDIHTMHQHGLFDSFQQGIEGPLAEYRSALKAPRPLYFNETSVGTQFTDLDGQAETLVKKMVYAWSRGAIGYNWFLFRGRSEHTNHYAMVDQHTGEPRPVFVTMAALARVMSGMSFDRQVDAGAGRLAFLFSNREGQRLVVAWTEAGSAGDALVALRMNTESRLVQLDTMGNATPVAAHDGIAVVQVAQTPGIFVVTGATNTFEWLGPIVDTQDTRVMLSNRTERALAIDGQTLKPGVSTALPGNVTERQFNLKLADDTYVLSAARRPVVVLSKNANGLVTAALKLNDRQFVRNIFENDPRSEHHTWQGPRDLSADVAVTLTDDVLRVRVEVMDDDHTPLGDDRKVSECDGVHIAIDSQSSDRRFWEFTIHSSTTGDAVIKTRQKESDAATVDHAVSATITRNGQTTVYDISLDRADLGLKHHESLMPGAQGVGLNVVVVDADDALREGWLQLTDGLVPAHQPAEFARLRVSE